MTPCHVPTHVVNFQSSREFVTVKSPYKSVPYSKPHAEFPSTMKGGRRASLRTDWTYHAPQVALGAVLEPQHLQRDKEECERDGGKTTIQSVQQK